MLTKSLQKLIRSLDSRKGRRREGLFVAEGPKLVSELIGHFVLYRIFVTDDLISACDSLLERIPTNCIEVLSVSELARISLQQSPQGIIALFEIPTDDVDFCSVATSSLTLALDDVQDPGNLGTIVRLADWFGVSHIFATSGTADAWNPKSVQASMGGLARTRVHILDNLPSALASLPASVPIFGTSLQGNIIWQQELAKTGVIIMGNEGRGMSQEVEKQCRQLLYIPNYPEGHIATDSLNVAMATGIVLSEFRRRL